MKKINYVKFLLDTIMVIVFTLLFNKLVLGLKFHEVAGLAIGAVVLVHCALNWKWIKGVTLKLFNKNTTIKTRIGYIIDILLLINVAIIIVTGIFISKELFPNLTLSGTPSFKFLHIASSYFSLMLIGIHLGLHWYWVISVFKKVFKIPEKNVFNYISKIMVVLMLAFGIYSANSVGYLSRISLTSSPGIEHRMKGEFNPNAKVGSVNQTKDSLQREKPKDIGVKGDNTSILKVITSQLGIISIFSIAAFYIEKFLKIRKRKIA